MKYCCLGKYGPYPAAGGASSGHLLFQEGKALALDMGSGTLPRLLASVKGYEVCGVVLTHLHPDHYSDLLVYAQYLAKCAERPMPLYLPRTPERVSSLLADTGVFDVHFTDAESTAQCGPFALRFAPTVHPLPGYAVRVDGDASCHACVGGVGKTGRCIAVRRALYQADCAQPIAPHDGGTSGGIGQECAGRGAMDFASCTGQRRAGGAVCSP